MLSVILKRWVTVAESRSLSCVKGDKWSEHMIVVLLFDFNDVMIPNDFLDPLNWLTIRSGTIPDIRRAENITCTEYPAVSKWKHNKIYHSKEFILPILTLGGLNLKFFLNKKISFSLRKDWGFTNVHLNLSRNFTHQNIIWAQWTVFVHFSH